VDESITVLWLIGQALIAIADAGTTETTVAVGLLGQILLVIILGIIKIGCGDDFSGDGIKTPGKEF
ncbi:uncharacterized protein METZ01_LOCUS437062, partial [marine metagenome]